MTATYADWPLAYLITFTCHGTWLHGDVRGSVDRTRNQVGTPFLEADPARQTAERASLEQPPYSLDEPRRLLTLEGILAVAERRGWIIRAVHVRTNHVHVVVQAAREPERVMNDFKASASKRLNEAYPAEMDRKRWTRHGSTRYVKKEDDLEAAVRYVLEEQGAPMAVYPPPSRPSQGEPRTK